MSRACCFWGSCGKPSSTTWRKGCGEKKLYSGSRVSSIGQTGSSATLYSLCLDIWFLSNTLNGSSLQGCCRLHGLSPMSLYSPTACTCIRCWRVKGFFFPLYYNKGGNNKP